MSLMAVAAATREQMDQAADLAGSRAALLGPKSEGALAGLQRSMSLLRAVEAFKATCRAEDEEPTEEDNWLVLIAALNAKLD